MKKIMALFLAFLCASASLPVFAQDANRIISAEFYTGHLYYCDADSKKVVIQNVAPMGTRNINNTEISQEATYTEIPILGTVLLPDGSNLPLEDCNIYVDSYVQLLLVKTLDCGIQVINMKFL